MIYSLAHFSHCKRIERQPRSLMCHSCWWGIGIAVHCSNGGMEWMNLYRGFNVKTRFLPIRTLHLSIRTLHHLAKAWFVYIVFFLFIFLILPSSLWLHPSYVICTWYYVCTWDNVEHREGQPDLNSHVVGRWQSPFSLEIRRAEEDNSHFTALMENGFEPQTLWSTG